MKTALIIILTSFVVIIAVAILNFASYDDKPFKKGSLKKEFKK